MALLDGNARDIGVVSLKCPDGRYPSVGLLHPPALRLERAAADLFGLLPQGLPDTRQWLDHGQWGVSHPLGADVPAPAPASPYAFLPAEGESLHQIPVGPVHAGIIEPGHFRFTASGETVVRLEERLGYVHKGIEGLMAGSSIDRCRQTCRQDVRRQHRGVFVCFCPRGRSSAWCRGSATRDLAASTHGRAGASGEPSGRYRRHLQRRRLRDHACPLRRAARARVARKRCCLRPSPDA